MYCIFINKDLSLLKRFIVHEVRKEFQQVIENTIWLNLFKTMIEDRH
jgi:hypothetical protein